MANSADACVPQTLTDFVFDLYDSVTLSQLPEEQGRLYNTVLRELSAKYFATSPWPSPQSIASECNGDPLFLAFYRELTHRHWHAVSRPTLRDRMEGWDVYRELFDELLETAESDATPSNTSQAKLFIIPEWTFDILHEFVYQFQGFCQFRTTLYASANKHNLLGGPGEPNPKAPHHVVENVAILKEAGDVWNVETVYHYLSRLVAIGTSQQVPPAYQYFGVFASVALSRLECLLSDYTGCLQAMAPILENPGLVVQLPKPQLPADEDEDETVYAPKTFPQIVHSVFAARISLTYHAGISFLMVRRYKDAIAVVGELCSYMQRGFKTGQLRKLPNSDQFFKNYERMIALLALCTHLCPDTGNLEESIVKVIREKHGAQLSKEAYGEIFVGCSPKFIHPFLPDFSQPGPIMEHAQRHQVRLLEQPLASQSTFRELRSFLKLYTSINVSKLEAFGIDSKTLMGLKLFSRQLESTASSSSSDAASSAEPAATEEFSTVPSSWKNATYKSALDIHFYLEDDEIVHVDEAEKQRRFENYFLGQIVQSYDIRKEANAIDI